MKCRGKLGRPFVLAGLLKCLQTTGCAKQKSLQRPPHFTRSFLVNLSVMWMEFVFLPVLKRWWKWWRFENFSKHYNLSYCRALLVTVYCVCVFQRFWSKYMLTSRALETCHTSVNLWVIENLAGFKFCL